MSRKLKIVEDFADIVPPPPVDFSPAPTRKRRAGWTAEKQRKFIDHLALTGAVGEASVIMIAVEAPRQRGSRTRVHALVRTRDARVRIGPLRSLRFAPWAGRSAPRSVAPLMAAA